MRLQCEPWLNKKTVTVNRERIPQNLEETLKLIKQWVEEFKAAEKLEAAETLVSFSEKAVVLPTTTSKSGQLPSFKEGFQFLRKRSLSPPEEGPKKKQSRTLSFNSNVGPSS